MEHDLTHTGNGKRMYGQQPPFQVFSFITGLGWFIGSIKARIGNGLAASIPRIAWENRSWLFYSIATFALVILIVLGRGLDSLVWNSYSPQIMRVHAILNQLIWPVNLVCSIAVAIGTRRFLQSESYRQDPSITALPRKDLFQAAMAAYYPFLVTLFFAILPFMAWATSFLPGLPQLYPLKEHLLNVQGTDQWGDDQILREIMIGLGMRLIEFLGFLAQVYLGVYLILGARTLTTGILRAIVVGVLVSFWLTATCATTFRIAENVFGQPHSNYTAFMWTQYIAYLLPGIVGLGLVWFLALRRFASGPLPVEEQPA